MYTLSASCIDLKSASLMINNLFKNDLFAVSLYKYAFIHTLCIYSMYINESLNAIRLIRIN